MKEISEELGLWFWNFFYGFFLCFMLLLISLFLMF
jgi:hypothetical protein